MAKTVVTTMAMMKDDGNKDTKTPVMTVRVTLTVAASSTMVTTMDMSGNNDDEHHHCQRTTVQ